MKVPSWAGRLITSLMLIPLVATVFAVLPQNTPAVSAAAPKALILGDTVSGSPSLAVSYTHLTLPTNREV